MWAVDGVGHFSRPGPRLVDSLEWLASVLHPSLVPPTGIPARQLDRFSGVGGMATTLA